MQQWQARKYRHNERLRHRTLFWLGDKTKLNFYGGDREYFPFSWLVRKHWWALAGCPLQSRRPAWSLGKRGSWCQQCNARLVMILLKARMPRVNTDTEMASKILGPWNVITWTEGWPGCKNKWSMLHRRVAGGLRKSMPWAHCIATAHWLQSPAHPLYCR